MGYNWQTNVMKRVMLTLMSICLAGLLTNCKNDDPSYGYPSAATVSRYIAGSWEVTTWITEDETYEDSGVVYKISYDEEEYGIGSVTKIEDGQARSAQQFYLEPLFKGDLDGSDSEKEVGVQFCITGSNDYIITKISATSMQMMECAYSGGKVKIDNEGMILTKIN